MQHQTTRHVPLLATVACMVGATAASRRCRRVATHHIGSCGLEEGEGPRVTMKRPSTRIHLPASDGRPIGALHDNGACAHGATHGADRRLIECTVGVAPQHALQHTLEHTRRRRVWLLRGPPQPALALKWPEWHRPVGPTHLAARALRRCLLALPAHQALPMHRGSTQAWIAEQRSPLVLTQTEAAAHPAIRRLHGLRPPRLLL